MSIEVKVPQLPESVTDATLVTWHKRAGDAVRRDENLVDLETDKVVLEVPAPSDGVLAEMITLPSTPLANFNVIAAVSSVSKPRTAFEAKAVTSAISRLRCCRSRMRSSTVSVATRR